MTEKILLVKCIGLILLLLVHLDRPKTFNALAKIKRDARVLLQNISVLNQNQKCCLNAKATFLTYLGKFSLGH